MLIGHKILMVEIKANGCHYTMILSFIIFANNEIGFKYPNLLFALII